MDDVTEAAAARRARADTLDRSEIRAQSARRFTVERMATDYLAVYRRQLGMSKAELRRVLGSEMRRFAG